MKCEGGPRNDSLVDRTLNRCTGIQGNRPSYRHSISSDNALRSQVEPAPDHHDIVVSAAVDACGSADHHDRFVRGLAFGECVAAKDPKVDAVVVEALPHAL